MVKIINFRIFFKKKKKIGWWEEESTKNYDQFTTNLYDQYELASNM